MHSKRLKHSLLITWKTWLEKSNRSHTFTFLKSFQSGHIPLLELTKTLLTTKWYNLFKTMCYIWWNREFTALGKRIPKLKLLSSAFPLSQFPCTLFPSFSFGTHGRVGRKKNELKKNQRRSSISSFWWNCSAFNHYSPLFVKGASESIVIEYRHIFMSSFILSSANDAQILPQWFR